MRLVLLLALVHGLVPGLAEIAETAIHYATEGHLAHSEADHGDLGDVGREHGCGGARHHCGCCASQAFVAHPAPSTPSPSPSREGTSVDGLRFVSLHHPAPPRRPPIAS